MTGQELSVLIRINYKISKKKSKLHKCDIVEYTSFSFGYNCKDFFFYEYNPASDCCKIVAVDWLNRYRVLIRKWLKELKAHAGVITAFSLELLLFLSSSLFFE